MNLGPGATDGHTLGGLASPTTPGSGLLAGRRPDGALAAAAVVYSNLEHAAKVVVQHGGCVPPDLAAAVGLPPGQEAAPLQARLLLPPRVVVNGEPRPAPCHWSPDYVRVERIACRGRREMTAVRPTLAAPESPLAGPGGLAARDPGHLLCAAVGLLDPAEVAHASVVAACTRIVRARRLLQTGAVPRQAGAWRVKVKGAEGLDPVYHGSTVVWAPAALSDAGVAALVAISLDDALTEWDYPLPAGQQPAPGDVAPWLAQYTLPGGGDSLTVVVEGPARPQLRVDAGAWTIAGLDDLMGYLHRFAGRAYSLAAEHVVATMAFVVPAVRYGLLDADDCAPAPAGRSNRLCRADPCTWVEVQGTRVDCTPPSQPRPPQQVEPAPGGRLVSQSGPSPTRRGAPGGVSEHLIEPTEPLRPLSGLARERGSARNVWGQLAIDTHITVPEFSPPEFALLLAGVLALTEPALLGFELQQDISHEEMLAYHLGYARAVHFVHGSSLYDCGLSPHTHGGVPSALFVAALPPSMRPMALPQHGQDSAPFGSWELFETRAVLRHGEGAPYGSYNVPGRYTTDEWACVRADGPEQRRVLDAAVRAAAAADFGLDGTCVSSNYTPGLFPALVRLAERTYAPAGVPLKDASPDSLCGHPIELEVPRCFCVLRGEASGFPSVWAC